MDMINSTSESSLCKSKRAISPRPRTVGDEVKVFHESSNCCSELCDKTRNMEEKRNSAACGREQERRPSVEDSNPPYKWAQSLLCLLEDSSGVNLFKLFLKQEGQDTRCLNFWFACRGMKRADPSNKKGLIRLIFEKKVGRIAAISAATREEIRRKLSANVRIDDTIFDSAQREVEAYMMKTTYPNFLKSDIYIQHLNGYQSDSSVERGTVIMPEPVDLLPTVHEDCELQVSHSNKASLTKDNLWQRYKMSTNSKEKLEGPAQLYFKSPYGNYSSYHSKYSSFLPASARNSELQSLSSDAYTDDTMSLTDGSVDYSMYSRSEKENQQKAAKHNVRVNKEDGLSYNTFIPLTQCLPHSTQQCHTQQEFHALLSKKLNSFLEKGKINERLKIIESDEYSRHDQSGAASFCDLSSAGDDDVQDILDQHVSRVWDDTPTCSSPLEPSTVPPLRSPFALQRINQFSRNGKDQEVLHSREDYYSDSSFSRSQASLGSTDSLEQCRGRRQQLRHRKSNTGSSSSGLDSGISMASLPPPNTSKVTYWFDTNRCSSAQDTEQSSKNSSTSSVLSRSRAPVQEGTQSQHWPRESPETSLNSMELRRRLAEEEGRNRAKFRCASSSRNYHDASKTKPSKQFELVEDGYSHRKQSRKSYPANMTENGGANMSRNDMTVVGYSYGGHSVPYLSKFPSKCMNLRQFKSLLSKRGNFRYFFKKASNDFGTGVVLEEITDDHEVLPLWEGKVFCVIESTDDYSS